MALITLKHGHRHRSDGSDPLEANPSGLIDSAFGLGNTTWDIPPAFNPSRYWGFTEDYNNLVTGLAGNLSSVVSGTGANTAGAAGDQTGWGWLISTIGTGGVTSDYAAVATVSQTPVRLGGGQAFYRWRGRFSALSDGTNTYGFRGGFISTTSGTAPTNGVYLRYLSTSSANWLLVTADNSSETVTDTGVAVTTANQSVGFEVNAAGTSVQAYRLSGGIWVPMGSAATTNIPTASGRETGYGHIIYRLVGTTARTVTSDYQTARCRFTSLR